MDVDHKIENGAMSLDCRYNKILEIIETFE